MNKRLAIWCGIVLIFVIFIVVISLLRSNINRYLATKSLDLLSKNIKAKISYQAVKGNIFTGISLSDVLVEFASGATLNTKSIKADYDLLSIIFKRKNYISSIKIINPSIYLSSKPNKPTQALKSFLPTALPLLLINQLEVDNGRIYFCDEIILDTLNLIVKIDLNPKQSRCLISKLSFYLPKNDIIIKSLTSNIDLTQNILQIKNFELKTRGSNIDLDGNIDFTKSAVNFLVKKSSISIAELGNHKGIINIDGKIVLSFSENNWHLTDIAGDLKYVNNKLQLQNTAIADGKGTLAISDKIIKLKYQQVSFDTDGSELSINGQYRLNPLIYQGKATLVNFLIPIRDIQLPLDGNLTFQGIKLDSVGLILAAACRKPAIESITAQGSIKKGQLLFEKVRIKNQTNILNLNGYYQKKSFDINYDISNFSLGLVSEIFNAFGHTNITLDGLIVGKGKIRYEENNVASSGTVVISNGLGDNFNFCRLNLIYDLDNITKLFGTVAVAVESPVWQGNQLDQINLIFENHSFKLQALHWKNNSLWATGKFQVTRNNLNCFVDSVLVKGKKEPIRNIKPFSFGINSARFYLSDMALAIGAGILRLDLTTNRSMPPNINFKCSQVNLEEISDLMQLGMPVKGTINVDVTNEFLKSDYIISASIYGLNVPIGLLKKNKTINSNRYLNSGGSDINLKYIGGSCLLSKSNLNINKLNLVYRQDTSQITGAIEIDHNRFLESVINLDVVFNDPGVWLFFFLENILDVREGIITGHGKITGSFQNPVLSGNVLIRNAQMFILATKSQCEKVNAQLTFNNQRIILNNLTGNTGTGTIMAQGYTELIGFSRVKTVAYTVEVTDAPLKPTKEIYAVVDGKINIDYQPTRKNEPKIPTLIAGNIIVKEALLTYEFTGSSQTNSGAQGGVNFNLKISGERDIWLRNRDIDVELSADLNIFNDGRNTIYSGELNSLHGNFYYLDHILKLTKGTITFDNISELNPGLDIIAELPVRPIKIQAGQTEAIKIILSLTGRLKEPIFTFISDPPMLFQEDIISYLTFNVTWQQMTSAESRDVFASAISEKLLGYFERELTKRLRSFVYLDYLMIESGLLAGTGAKVTVGKYIGRNLYVSYEYNVSGTANDIFQIEYYISKSDGIIGERDRNGRYNLKYQHKIRY